MQGRPARQNLGRSRWRTSWRCRADRIVPAFRGLLTSGRDVPGVSSAGAFCELFSSGPGIFGPARAFVTAIGWCPVGVLRGRIGSMSQETGWPAHLWGGLIAIFLMVGAASLGGSANDWLERH